MAEELEADPLLMDERKGRRIARQVGIAITGTVGILLQAYDERILQGCEVEECPRKMQETNIRISDPLWTAVYKHIGKNEKITIPSQTKAFHIHGLAGGSLTYFFLLFYLLQPPDLPVPSKI